MVVAFFDPSIPDNELALMLYAYSGTSVFLLVLQSCSLAVWRVMGAQACISLVACDHDG